MSRAKASPTPACCRAALAVHPQAPGRIRHGEKAVTVQTTAGACPPPPAALQTVGDEMPCGLDLARRRASGAVVAVEIGRRPSRSRASADQQARWRRHFAPAESQAWTVVGRAPARRPPRPTTAGAEGACPSARRRRGAAPKVAVPFTPPEQAVGPRADACLLRRSGHRGRMRKRQRRGV